MLSVTATTSPARTSSPAATGTRRRRPARLTAHEAALVARDPVRDAVDLDEQVAVLERGHRPVRAPAVAQPALVLGDLLDLRVDPRAVHLDPVAARAGLADADAVARAAVDEVELVADVGLGVRPAAPGERVEAAAGVGRGRVAQRDRRLHERGVGVAHRLHVALRLEAVEPAGVDLAGAQLRAAEQLEQEALVGGALVERDHRVGDRAAQAGDRLLARAAVGDDLGDHRVELRRDRVALGDAAVDADARPRRQPQQRDAGPGAGAKPRAGSSALRRTSIAWPRGGGGSPSSRPPAAMWSCSRTRSAPVTISVTGCSTWSRALTSMNEKRSRLGLVEELGGARAAVAGRAREPHGGLRQLGAPARA